METREVSVEMAEEMGYLPELYWKTLKEFDGQYVFGRTIDDRIEARYRSNLEKRDRAYGVDETKHTVSIPESWLREHNFIR